MRRRRIRISGFGTLGLLVACLLATGLWLQAAGAQAQGQPSEGYRLVDTWTTTTAGLEVPQLERPGGIDVASDQTIYLVDSRSDEAYHLSATGSIIDQWTVEGIGSPVDVAVGGSRVYVLGNAQSRIYDRDGSNARNWNAGGRGLAFGPNQRVYVSRLDRGLAVIDVYDVDGNRLATWRDEAFPILSAEGLDVGPDGRIYLAADGAIYVFEAGGPGGITASTLLRVERRLEDSATLDVAVDEANRAYAVMQSGRFVGWSASGQFQGALDLSGSRWLAVGPGGGAVVTVIRSGFNGIARIADRNDYGSDPQLWGENNETLGEIETPRRVAAALAGSSFVLDRSDRMQLWTRDGRPQQQWRADDYAIDIIGGAPWPCYAEGRAIACSHADPARQWRFDVPDDSYITAADGDTDRIAALDLAGQQVWLLDRAGNTERAWPLATGGDTSYLAVSDVAIEGDTVYLADQAETRIDLRNLDGGRSGSIDLLINPLRVDVAAGRVYVLGRDGRIWKYDRSGTLLTVWMPLTQGTANDVSAADDGRVLVPDPPGNRVLVFDPDGPVPGQVPSIPSDKCDVEVDKIAAPLQVTQGDPVTVQLRVSGSCPLGDGRLDVALIIDESGSMSGAPMAAAQAAALAFINELNPRGAQVAVVSFDTTATVLQPLTGDLREAVRAIADLEPGGQTNYIDAMDKAGEELSGPAARDDAPQVAVMMTDGKPTNRPGVEAAAERLKDTPATLYTIGLGLTVNQDLLREMASRPDYFFSAPSEAELADVYRAIARRLTAARVIDEATVTDIVPGDMQLELGSIIPPPDSWDPATRMLTWSLDGVPASGDVLSYRVRPTVPGFRDTNVRAEIHYIDASGESGSAVFPVPSVIVFEGEKLIYLPAVYRNRCTPQRADVILAFDTSGSMQEPAGDGSGRSKLDAAVTAGRAFLNNMTFPGDQAAIVAFDREARMVRPLSGSRGDLLFGLGELTTGAGTRIDLGIQASVAELLGRRHIQANNPVIILLTDGRPTAGTESQVLRDASTARGLGFQVFTIGLGPDTDRLLLGLVAGQQDRSFFAPNAAALNLIYDSIAGKALCE